MKSMFEYMGTIIILTLISFVFVSLMSVELQNIAARNYHTRVVETIQYAGEYDKVSAGDYGTGFSYELNSDNTLKVTYSYDVVAPIIGTIKANDIVGYAR